MIARGEAWLRRARRWFSRNEWVVRWLRLPKSPATAAEPGLVLIQIDGLSRCQFEAALKKRRMPFLRRLMQRENYRLHTFYSGLPSSTPGVQGELFYGVKCAVPAFSFRDPSNHEIVRMFDTAAAARVEDTLARLALGLLAEGSAYADIYSGGAAESHYCVATTGWRGLFRAANLPARRAAPQPAVPKGRGVTPLTLAGIVLWHGWSLVRIVALVVLEMGLAVVAFLRRLDFGLEFWKELKFVPSRVAVSILLRELVTVGASLDVTRGLPVVHVNFLGYDEQAHRRGPSSAFAHWTLKGIDDAVKRIWQAARRSACRDYDIWIYSDHGQEHTVPYEREHGRPVEQAVAELFDRPVSRTEWASARVQVAAMGPLGHVYPAVELSPDQRDRLAESLVHTARIPLVLARTQPGQAQAWTDAGTYDLPRQAVDILGANHPFLAEAAQDLVDLCHHPQAGTLLISGWRLHSRPVSFPIEHGAHGGPGSEETRALALLPSDAPVRVTGKDYLRPLDLREAALHRLGRTPRALSARTMAVGARRTMLRVMTYNVHSCVGMDGKLSPARIARVIALCDPDIVALQELDVGRTRTREIDQAHAIANELEMEFHFHPALQLEEERYGDAILSRFPMRLVHAGPLPVPPSRPRGEPRGALWVAVEVEGRTVQLLNTHLGLGNKERLMQVEALLGPDWLANPQCCDPIILCGDLNATPNSQVCRRLARRLRDAQRMMDGHRPRRTFFSRLPLGRIDHVFVGPAITVVRVEVPRTQLVCTASDHLPLVVEVRFEG